MDPHLQSARRLHRGHPQYGDRAAQASFVASLTGTYTVVVSTADAANDAVGDYILRLARMPGAFTVPAGDHGGAMTNGVNHPGRIEIGDLDMWSFAACPGASAAVTINEVPVGPGTPDPGFWPWIRLYNSAGALVAGGSQYGDTVAQITHTVTQSGTFTVVVGTADAANDATGDYTVRVQVAGSACGAPTTATDSYTTAANSPLSVAAPGVLGNDNTNGGGPMTAELVSAVTVGTLALNANGSFTFTPPAAFTGATSFTYRAVNGFGPGNTATVDDHGQPPVPTTAPETYSTPMGTPLNIPAPGVLGNDLSNGGGALSAQLVTTTTNGILALAVGRQLQLHAQRGIPRRGQLHLSRSQQRRPGNAATVSITVTDITEPQPRRSCMPPTSPATPSCSASSAPTTGPAPTGYVLEGGVAARRGPGQHPDRQAPIRSTRSTAPLGIVLCPRAHAGGRGAQSGLERNQDLRQRARAAIGTGQPDRPGQRQLRSPSRGETPSRAAQPGGVVLDVSGSLNTSLPLGLTDSFQFNGVPGGTYTLSLRAVNAAGSSPPSNADHSDLPGQRLSGLGCAAAAVGVPRLPPGQHHPRHVGSSATGRAPTSFVLNVTGASGGASAPRPRAERRGRARHLPLSVAAANACG